MAVKYVFNPFTGKFDAVTKPIGPSAISAGGALISSGTVVLSNSNGISFGVNGQTVTASVAAQSLQSISAYRWADFHTHNTVWPGQASFQMISMPLAISASMGVVMIELLGDSRSSGGLTVHVAAYRLTASTAGNLTTHSGGFTWSSGSATSASSLYGGVSGTRYRSFTWNVNMTPGDYLFGFAISTANNGTARIFGRQGANVVGPAIGLETNYFLDGYTNSTIAAFPPTIVANNTNFIRTGLSAQRQPAFLLIGTV